MPVSEDRIDLVQGDPSLRLKNGSDQDDASLFLLVICQNPNGTAGFILPTLRRERERVGRPFSLAIPA